MKFYFHQNNAKMLKQSWLFKISAQFSSRHMTCFLRIWFYDNDASLIFKWHTNHYRKNKPSSLLQVGLTTQWNAKYTEKTQTIWSNLYYNTVAPSRPGFKVVEIAEEINWQSSPSYLGIISHTIQTLLRSLTSYCDESWSIPAV